MFPITDFALGCNYCPKDKKAYNNLYNAAKKQKEMPWFEEQMADPKKRKALFKAYHARCPEKASKKRETFYIAQYREEIRLTESHIHDEIGRMMNIAAYTDWAMLPANGGKSAIEADMEFKRMMAEEDAVTDDEGGEKYPKRVWVKTDTIIKKRKDFWSRCPSDLNQILNPSGCQQFFFQSCS